MSSGHFFYFHRCWVSGGCEGMLHCLHSQGLAGDQSPRQNEKQRRGRRRSRRRVKRECANRRWGQRHFRLLESRHHHTMALSAHGCWLRDWSHAPGHYFSLILRFTHNWNRLTCLPSASVGHKWLGQFSLKVTSVSVHCCSFLSYLLWCSAEKYLCK